MNDSKQAMDDSLLCIQSLTHDIAETMQRSSEYLRDFKEMAKTDDVAPFIIQMAKNQCGLDDLHIHIDDSPPGTSSEFVVVPEGPPLFRIVVYVALFRPEEVSVKIVDGYVVVNCKHGELSEESSFVTRELTRRYALPERIDPKDLISYYTAEGTLTVEVKQLTDLGENEGEIEGNLEPHSVVIRVEIENDACETAD